MIPLINVVFLMLAFLVLAGQIEAHRQKLAVPKSSSVIERSSEFQELFVLADGSMEIDGRTVEMVQLQQILPQLLSAERTNENTAIQVFADSRLLVSDLQLVLNELQRVGVQTINLATLPATGNTS